MQVDDAAQPPICVGTQCGFPSDQFWSCQLDRCGSEPLLNLRTMYGNGILDCCRTDLLALEQWRFPRTNILSQPILRANRMGTPQRPALHSTDRPCNLVSYTAIPPSDARLSSCALCLLLSTGVSSLRQQAVAIMRAVAVPKRQAVQGQTCLSGRGRRTGRA